MKELFSDSFLHILWVKTEGVHHKVTESRLNSETVARYDCCERVDDDTVCIACQLLYPQWLYRMLAVSFGTGSCAFNK